MTGEINVVDKIMSYEQGDLSVEETIELFGHLVKTGMAWQLQGTYGRTAAALIRQGIIDKQGNVDMDKFHRLREGV